jgi:hypothetical protein
VSSNAILSAGLVNDPSWEIIIKMSTKG